MFQPTHPATPKQNTPPLQHNAQPIYIVVFGYPPDKYSVTVEYFKSLGQTTEPEQSNELLNCFRIGYLQPAEAIRAIRKNGEILGGSYMVGAKWAVRVRTVAHSSHSADIHLLFTGSVASGDTPWRVARAQYC